MAGMAPKARREDALSRERIVAAAVEMLDATGENGLTFRALSAHLRTGAGAIYWHVANKSELLVAAGNAVLAPVLAAESAGETPEDTIRALALGIFDAIDAHPWVGSELSRPVSPSAMLRIFERIGRQIQALGVPAADQFAVATALLSYIIGVGRQNGAQAADVEPGTNRPQVLGAVAATWERLDPDEFPFIRSIAAQLPGHDDREQFLAGVDLFLAGIAGPRRTPATGLPRQPARTTTPG
jgi:AcrR family transcriptional regulator